MQVLQTCEQALEEKLKQKVELLVEPSADPSIHRVCASLPNNQPKLKRGEVLGLIAGDADGVAVVTRSAVAVARARGTSESGASLSGMECLDH